MGLVYIRISLVLKVHVIKHYNSCMPSWEVVEIHVPYRVDFKEACSFISGFRGITPVTISCFFIKSTRKVLNESVIGIMSKAK